MRTTALTGLPAREPGLQSSEGGAEAVSATNAQPIRVLIIEGHALVRAGLRMLIESRGGFAVVGEAADVSEACELMLRVASDVVVVDPDFANDTDLELIRELHVTVPTIRIIVLTAATEPQTHLRAVRSGAVGVVPKAASVDVFLQAIERVHAGEAWLNRSLTAKLVLERRPVSDRGVYENASPLSRREVEVTKLVCEGLGNEAIARRLFISEATVRHHLTAIFAKLNLPGRFGLITYAYNAGLAEPRG